MHWAPTKGQCCRHTGQELYDSSSEVGSCSSHRQHPRAPEGYTLQKFRSKQMGAQVLCKSKSSALVFAGDKSFTGPAAPPRLPTYQYVLLSMKDLSAEELFDQMAVVPICPLPGHSTKHSVPPVPMERLQEICPTSLPTEFGMAAVL